MRRKISGEDKSAVLDWMTMRIVNGLRMGEVGRKRKGEVGANGCRP